MFVVCLMQFIFGFQIGSFKEIGGSFDVIVNLYVIGKVIEVKDQYLLGDVLFVVLIVFGEKFCVVVLFLGKWYDFYIGKFVGENEMIIVMFDFVQIFVFVKDGSFVLMIEECQWSLVYDEVLLFEICYYGEKFVIL